MYNKNKTSYNINIKHNKNLDFSNISATIITPFSGIYSEHTKTFEMEHSFGK